VNASAPRGNLLEPACGLDDLLRPGLVEPALGAHAADDPAATDRHVGVLLREEHRRADALIAPAGRIRPVDPGDDRDAEFLQLGVPEEHRAAAPAIGIDLVLLCELDPRAIDEPDQGQPETLGQVGDPQLVLGLPGHPRSGHDLVVESDEDAPLAADPGQPIDHAGHTLLGLARVVQGVQGTERPGIHEVLDPVPDRHLATRVDLLGGQPRVLRAAHLGAELLEHRRNLVAVLGHLLDVGLLERLAERIHLLEVRAHGPSPSAYLFALR
jgi:hypothetical protein